MLKLNWSRAFGQPECRRLIVARWSVFRAATVFQKSSTGGRSKALVGQNSGEINAEINSFYKHVLIFQFICFNTLWVFLKAQWVTWKMIFLGDKIHFLCLFLVKWTSCVSLFFAFPQGVHAERVGGMGKRPITSRQKESIKKVSKLASLLGKGLGTQQEHLHLCQEHFLIQAPC